MSIWFTADTHFNHDGIRTYCKRPFETCEEMDEAIIANWNSKIQGGDTVYHLGDFSFGNKEKCQEVRHRLKGKIHLILGNHDYKNKIHTLTHVFTEIATLITLKYNKQKLVLCHYALRTWDSSHYNSYQLYGHSHGRLDGIGKQMDVGVDCQKFFPIHIDDVMNMMENRPDNPNYIRPENKTVVNDI